MQCLHFFAACACTYSAFIVLQNGHRKKVNNYLVKEKHEMKLMKNMDTLKTIYDLRPAFYNAV